MKKLICALMALLLIVSLAACKPPVDDPMENPNPPTDATTEATAEATDATDPAPSDGLNNPEATGTEDPLNLMIYEGRYILDEEDPQEGQTHVVDVVSYGRFLTLEHSLYQDGSLYAFWVEEFWPNEDEVFTDIYDARKGKIQSFSVQTSDTQYESAPMNVQILYHDSGIAIDWQETGVREYYIIDGQQPAPHSDTQTLAKQLQEIDPCTIGQGPLGSWQYWSGEIYTMVNFGQDGTLFWINKILGKPVEIYRGAWGINETGTVSILAERLGSGTMPYHTRMAWEYDTDINMLVLEEEEIFFLYALEGWGYLTAYEAGYVEEMTQSNALTYVQEMWGIQDYYRPEGAQEDVYYAYYMPWFYGSNDAVISINEDIRQMFGALIEQGFNEMDEGRYLECEEVVWEQYPMGDIVAVAVHSYGLYEQHMVYYYDTATQTRLYAREVLQKLGIDEQMYLDGLTAAVQESFDAYHFELSEDQKAEQSYENYRAWTMSDDNINLDRGFIINDFGEIITYVVVETVYGSCWEAVYPFGTATPDAVG